GFTWQRVSSPVDEVFASSSGARLGRIAAVAANDVRPDVITVAVVIPGEPVAGGIWRSPDAGRTWQYLLMGKDAANILSEKRGVGSNVETGWLTRDFSWWWGDLPKNRDQLALCASDPDIILRQDDGRTIGTRDGGKAWAQLYTDHVADNRWTSRGYEVTTCYKVYWNPTDHDRMFIAYTDIGFFRSEDRGKSWIYSLRGARHTNTVYDLAIDPARPERMYAATSGSHDQPAWKTLVPPRDYSKGGVAMTEDGGKTWVNLGEGDLPNASCGSIILDPESPVDARVLYVTMWGNGVFKSDDGGKTWRKANEGIDTDVDFNFWRLARAADGRLYLITTKTIEVTDGVYTFGSGALYTSDDGAGTWQRLVKGDWICYPWDVLCDPRDAEAVYVASYSDPHVERGRITPGGVYRSGDRGGTWERILEPVDPADTRVIYVGTAHDGVFRSADGGKVWVKLAGLPFKNALGISVDPDDRDTIYVTTFGGGVWQGSAYGAGRETSNR
ncbi:MAG: WD40/YVTN/BNR-like repeat-containing protein, partial [Planctomycetota bacterium]